MSNRLNQDGSKPNRFVTSLSDIEAEALVRLAGERYAAGDKSGIAGALRDLIRPALKRYVRGDAT